MNVASKELSEELYELSNWEIEQGHLYVGKELINYNGGYKGEQIPAYDAGFLLRKLPPHFNTGDARGAFEFFLKTTGREWFAGYNKPELGKWLYDKNHGVWETPCSDDTPENALCRLSIELHKQGILKKGIGDE